MHIHPFPTVNLNELPENSKKRKEEAARKRKVKLEAKKGNVKKVKRKEGDSCFLLAIRQVEGCYGEGHSSEVAGHTVSIFFKRTHKQMN